MNTTLTIKTPKKLRNAAKKAAGEIGVSLTTVMNVMLRQFVRDRVLVIEAECPFPSHTPNAETRRAIKEIRDGKNLKTFSTFEELEKRVRSI